MTTTVNPRVGTHSALTITPELFQGQEGFKEIRKFLDFNRRVSTVEIFCPGGENAVPFVKFRYMEDGGSRVLRVASVGYTIVKDRKTDSLTIHSAESFAKHFDTYPPAADREIKRLADFILANFPGFIKGGSAVDTAIDIILGIQNRNVGNYRPGETQSGGIQCLNGPTYFAIKCPVCELYLSSQIKDGPVPSHNCQGKKEGGQ